MSGTEALMWAVEKDPALRSDFVNVTVLDGTPDPARVRAKVAAAVTAIPRLAQRVVAAPLRIAPPEWVDDPTFDLDYHLRTVRVPAPGDTRALLDLCAQLAEAPFDRSRPLWEFTLVEGLDDGRAALVQKVHHTIIDGVGGLRLSLCVVDLERDAPATAPVVPAAEPGETAAAASPPADPLDRSTPLDVLARAVVDAARGARGLVLDGVTGAADLARRPQQVPGRVRGGLHLAGSVRRQLLAVEPARSQLMAARSVRRHFEVLDVPLEPARVAAKRLGASINDLYVAGIARGLGAYHAAMGAPCTHLVMAMPVNLRGREEVGGNRFAPVRVLVPAAGDGAVGDDAAAHVAAVRDALARTRGEATLAAADALAGLAARFPTSVLVTFTRAQARSLDFATSNLRASPVQLYLAGRAIEATYPFGPRAGTPLNVTLISYAGVMSMGANVDPSAITEPDRFMACLRAAFDDILAA
jgi:diacylglycerol O-acyltransferase